MAEWMEIDGSRGEGGGQILRTALALAVLQRSPLHLHAIRAGRKRPGLQRQHLACVEAARRFCNARVRGADQGSTALRFEPGADTNPHLEVDIGSAGSTTLVLQTVLPVLLRCQGASQVSVRGGTHNPMAPPLDFLARSFGPVLRRLGARPHFRCDRRGFAPAGGGRVTMEIEAGQRLERIDLEERGELLEASAEILWNGVPERALSEVESVLGERPEIAVRRREVRARGPGFAVLLVATHAEVEIVFSGFGDRRSPPRRAAEESLAAHDRDRAAGAFCDEHLADQLVLPFALAGGGSFTMPARERHTSRHFETNLEVVRRFWETPIHVEAAGPGRERVVFGG